MSRDRAGVSLILKRLSANTLDLLGAASVTPKRVVPRGILVQSGDGSHRCDPKVVEVYIIDCYMRNYNFC
jgi:hypothetical protein